MRNLLYLMLLFNLAFTSCKKTGGGTVLDTHVDAMILSRQGEDLLAKNLAGHIAFDIQSLKVLTLRQEKNPILAQIKSPISYYRLKEALINID